jgi:hypothetical protein
MPWDPLRLEIQNGLIAMSTKLQRTLFQGQASNSGGMADNELGLYDPNGFTGFRSILNTGNAVNFQPYLTSTPDSITEAVGEASVPISDSVGVPPNIIFMRATEAQKLAAQQLPIQRTVDTVEFTPGVRVPAITTQAGMLPIIVPYGDAIGTYTASTFDSNTVADIYLINTDEVVIPYLGSPSPSLLEIPPGVSGQLTRLSILWFMGGLAVRGLPFHNKLRADLGTS